MGSVIRTILFLASFSLITSGVGCKPATISHTNEKWPERVTFSEPVAPELAPTPEPPPAPTVTEQPVAIPVAPPAQTTPVVRPDDGNQMVIYEKSFLMNQEVPVVFRMRDYANAPKVWKNTSELEPYLIVKPGQATFRFQEMGTLNQIKEEGDTTQPNEIVYYTIFDFRGDQDNMRTGFSHPRYHDEVGWDPAPLPVLIIDGKREQSNSPLTPDLAAKFSVAEEYSLQASDWTRTVVGWKVSREVTNPELALEYLGMDGVLHYVKVNR